MNGLTLPTKGKPKKGAKTKGGKSKGNAPPKQLPSELRSIASKKSKKRAVTTSFNPGNKSHMISELNLSGFAPKERGFKQIIFKELVDSIVDMRCLTTIILQNNGIEDKHWKELETIFTNYNIKKIDLSRNQIGATLGTYLGLIMRDGVDHIEWLDLSRNCFSNNTTSLKVLL